MADQLAAGPGDLQDRLVELAKLQDGWFDNAGVAPPAEGLRWLTRAWEQHGSALPRPYAFPTPEGHVLLEWPLRGCTPSLDIDTRTCAALLHLDLAGDDQEHALDLANAAGWAQLAQHFTQAFQARGGTHDR